MRSQQSILSPVYRGSTNIKKVVSIRAVQGYLRDEGCMGLVVFRDQVVYKQPKFLYLKDLADPQTPDP